MVKIDKIIRAKAERMKVVADYKANQDQKENEIIVTEEELEKVDTE